MAFRLGKYRIAFALALLWATPRVEAAIFNFNSSFINGGVSETQSFRMWLPDAEGAPAGTAASVRGMIFVLPGSGEDWRNAAQSVGFQRSAQALGFGVIAARSMIWGNWDSEVNGVVQSVLNSAAAVSNRPELVNAPYAPMGVSQGGFNASRIALANPDRAIGFVNIRGVYGQPPPLAGAPVLAVPGLNIVASEDTIVRPAATFAEWAEWRSIAAPHALMVEWDTTHYDTRKGQSWETAMYWIGEAARQRYASHTPLSTTPGVRPTLDSLDYSAGWLAGTPSFSFPPPALTGPPQQVEIASLASGAFSAPPASGSWLPNEGAAQVYQAFGSGDGISRAHAPNRPRQSPFYFLLDPVHDTNTYRAPLFETGSVVPITVEMRPQDLRANGIRFESVDFFLNGELVGTDFSTTDPFSDGDLSWTLNVPMRSAGIHALVAVGHTSSGRSYSTFRTVLVEGVVPEPSSLAVALFATALLSGRVRRRQRVSVPECDIGFGDCR